MSILIFWMCLFLSFLGWGGALARLLRLDPGPFSVATRAAWGTGLSLCAASFYLALIPGSPQLAWWLWISSGLASFLVDVRRHLSERRARSGSVPFESRSPFAGRISFARLTCFGLAALCIGSAIYLFWEAIGYKRYNCFDDLLAYFAHVRMILDRGDFSDPFSFRRLSSYGGQQILQSFFVLGARDDLIQVFEEGFLRALCALLIIEIAPRSPGSRWPGWQGPLLALVYLWAESPRVNSTAENSALLFVLALADLFLKKELAEWRPGRAILAGMLAAALIQLRANLALGAALFVGAFWLMERERLRSARALGWISLTCALLLAPGAWMLYQSSGTPFFPLFSGNLHPESQAFEGLPIGPSMPEFLLQVGKLSSVWVLGACLIGGLARWAELKQITGIVAVGILVLAATSLGVSVAQPASAPYRYSYPFLMGAFLLFFSRWLPWAVDELRRVWSRGDWKALGWRQALQLIPCVAFLSAVLHVPTAIQREAGASGSRAQPFSGLAHDFFAEERVAMEELQGHVPEGSKVFSVVESPFLFRFDRNEIELIDIIGEASPRHGLRPELPFPEIDSYLASLGFEYIVFVDPDYGGCQYSRPRWKHMLADPGEFRYLRAWGPRHQRFFDYLDWKKASGTVIHRAGAHHVARIGPTPAQR